MVNQHAAATISAQWLSTSHVRPDYTGYCFASIPGSILDLFAIPTGHRLPSGTLPANVTFDKVIFIFIDAFGWNLFREYAASSPLLGRFQRDGIVSQLTSQFPSTTTAHVTTMHTSQPVGSHGMFEWIYYEPAIDAVISPLFNSYAGDKVRDTLLATDLDPHSIYPRQTIYPRLTKRQITSYIFADQTYAASPYNMAVNGQATHQLTFRDFPQALDLLSRAVSAEPGKAYFYLYWGNLDALSHTYGPMSPEARAEIQLILEQIERYLLDSLGPIKNALLLITADHGQDQIDPAQTVFLNHLIPEIAQVFKTDGQGRPIVPAGSCKSFFLYVKEEALGDTYSVLTSELRGVAEVHRVDQLVAGGYFGAPISDRFLARVGNLVITPLLGQSVWWNEPGRFGVRHKGFHGGLTHHEMLIPFLAMPL